MRSTIRSTRAWQRLRAATLADPQHHDQHGRPICSLCRKPIDMRLSGLAKWGPTVHHVLEVETHPHLALDPGNLVPAHRTCNISHENKRRNRLRRCGHDRLNAGQRW